MGHDRATRPLLWAACTGAAGLGLAFWLGAVLGAAGADRLDWWVLERVGVDRDALLARARKAAESAQRQARKAMARKVMEMRADNMPEEQIQQQQRMLQQNILQSTELGLKEHFVLQKIAELKGIDVTEDDLEDEIARIAEQNDESPRRVRARLEKEDSIESLAAELVERKALDLILDTAEYEDVPLEKEEGAVGTVEQQTVPGEMHDPTAQPPAAAVGTPATEGETPPATQS